MFEKWVAMNLNAVVGLKIVRIIDSDQVWSVSYEMYF